MIDYALVDRVLHKELVVALGCTEPVAVAYAAALAARAAGGRPASIVIAASANVLKNAMAVGIPGTPFRGMPHAAALGALGGEPEKRLACLAGLGDPVIAEADAFVAAGKVAVRQAKTDRTLYIEATVTGPAGEGVARIEDEHERVTLLALNGEALPGYELAAGEPGPAGADASSVGLGGLDIAGVYEYAETAPLESLGLIREAIRLNGDISREGLTGDYGLRIGKVIKENMDLGLLSDDLLNDAMARAAAASDARMAGSSMPVMSNTGSGNQGITATIPVLAVGERLAAPQERILRAVTLSNLMTVYIKYQFGRLSALCGAVIAGAGAACGIAYLLGAGLAGVRSAVQNMIGNVSGMLCDGAKGDCALKISTCTAAAVQAALMAARGITIPPIEGIVDADPERTIRNLARLGIEGSPTLDGIILDVMVNKGRP